MQTSIGFTVPGRHKLGVTAPKVKKGNPYKEEGAVEKQVEQGEDTEDKEAGEPIVFESITTKEGGSPESCCLLKGQNWTDLWAGVV